MQQLGRRAIFLTHHRAQVPEPLPDSVLWVAYAPLQGLLPHCAALIHHGGIGTTAEALRAGVPQLVVPFAHDQFDNGERVKALGVGSTLPAARLRVGNLRRRLEGLLASDDVQAQCRAAAARLAENRGAGAVCEIIVDAASPRA